MVSISDCRCEGGKFKFPKNFTCTVRYSVVPIKCRWVSGLSCLFLLQNYWPMLYGCRLESCRWLYSVYTNKKLSHHSTLLCVLGVAPTMKRSAAQPKTTRLCSSLIVISLWFEPSSIHDNWSVPTWRRKTEHRWKTKF